MRRILSLDYISAAAAVCGSAVVVFPFCAAVEREDAEFLQT